MMSMFVSLLLFTACQSEIDTKPAAEVAEAPVVKAKPEMQKHVAKLPADVKKMAVQPVLPEGAIALAAGSKVEFIGAKVTEDHRGGFEKVTGYVTVQDDGQISAVNLDIDMTSVYADPFPYAEKFVSHLKDEDFFHVEKFPKATFKSTKIDGGKVTGIFELRGVQKEITFDATLASAAPYSLKAEFKINRKLWGIEYAGKADNLIKDDVAIIANLTFK